MSSRAPILMALLLIPLLAIGIWMVTDDSASEGNLGDDLPSLPGMTAEVQDPEPTTEDSLDVGEVETSAFDGYEDWDAEPATKETSLRFVKVVDADGSPVAGADVALMPVMSSGDNPFRMFAMGEGPKAYRTVKSGKDGSALLSPLPARRFQIEARANSRFGSLYFDQRVRRQDGEATEEGAEEEEMVVQLAPLKVVRVAVSDPSGQPVPDLSVQATFHLEEGTDMREFMRQQFAGNRGGGRGERGSRGMRGSGFTARARTDPDAGMALVEIRSDSLLYGMDKIDVQAILPGQDPVSQVVTLPEEGTTDVSLRIPHTATLDIVVHDQDGQPTDSDVGVSWFIAEDENAQPSAYSRRRRRGSAAWGSRSGRLLATDGKATLTGFPPNREVRFTTNLEGRVSHETTVTLNGDLHQQVILGIGAETPYITFILADPSGHPLRNFRVSAGVEWDNPDSTDQDPMARMLNRGRIMRMRSRSTDKEGRIRLAALPNVSGQLEVFPSGRNSFWMRSRRGPGRGNDGPDPLIGVNISTLEGGEERDLGILSIPSSMVIASGMVVNEDGKPVSEADVSVTVRYRPEPGQENSPGIRTERRGPFGPGMSRGFSGRSDDSGQFLVLGEADTNFDHFATASKGRSRAAEIEFQLSRSDLILKLVPTGGIKGAIVRPANSEGLSVNAYVYPDGKDARRDRQRVRIRGNGSFSVRDLMPGNYTFVAEINNRVDQQVPGIVVPPGKTAEPPALQSLAVGRLLQRATVRVTDLGGSPLAGASVRYTQTQPSPQSTGNNENGRRNRRINRRSQRERTNKEGIATSWVYSDSATQVRISLNGYIAQTVENAAFPMNVALLKAPELTLTFAPLPQIEGVRNYRLALIPESQGNEPPATEVLGQLRRFRSRGFESGRLAAGAVSAKWNSLSANTYTVQIYAEQDRSRSRRGGRGGRGGRSRGRGSRLGPLPVGTVTWDASQDAEVPLNLNIENAVRDLILEAQQEQSGR